MTDDLYETHDPDEAVGEEVEADTKTSNDAYNLKDGDKLADVFNEGHQSVVSSRRADRTAWALAYQAGYRLVTNENGWVATKKA